MGDPQFPDLAMKANAQHQVFQTIFRTYSRLELTRVADRPVAIMGVERRLAGAMSSGVAFGVFDHCGHLHRSLLWRRAGDTLLQRIEDESLGVPTWSWMAFQGAIDYVDVRSPKIMWNSGIALRPPKDGAPAELRAPVTAFAVDELLRSPDLLVLDTHLNVNLRTLKCVVVGKEPGPSGSDPAEVYHVVVVAPSPAPPPGGSATYERRGIASVRKIHIAPMG